MSRFLYQSRILALDKELYEARRHIKRLMRQTRYKPGSVKSTAVKTQLDLVNSLIRLLKEETAFYVKLGQQFDSMKIMQIVTGILARRDPDMAVEIMVEADKLMREIEDTYE